MLIKMSEIVVTGRSNVGKSSIIRQLTGKKVKTGKTPGVTRDFDRIDLGKNLELVDLPGFGYIAGMSHEKQEKTKTRIVNYLEKNADKIISTIQVIDASTFLEIVDRWNKRNQIPVSIELFSFLQGLKLNPIIAANKIDKIKGDELDEVLDKICIELGLDPPWRQWLDVIVPLSAKTGKGIDELDKLLRSRFQDAGKEELLKYL